MTVLFSFLMLAGVILFGLGAKGVVVARLRPAGGAFGSVLTLLLGIFALLIGAAAAVACLAIVTPAWSVAARWAVLVLLAAVSAGGQIRRALGPSPVQAGAPAYFSSSCVDDDDDGFPQTNPTTGLPMMAGGMIDVGGNCFMQSPDD